MSHIPSGMSYMRPDASYQAGFTINSLCPHCNNLTRADLLYRHEDTTEVDGHIMDFTISYMAKCQYCRELYMLHYVYDESIIFSAHDDPDLHICTHPPQPSHAGICKSHLKKYDQLLFEIYGEVVSAPTHRLNGLAAIGLRAFLDRLTAISDDGEIGLATRVAKLAEQGRISTNLAEQLAKIVDAGDAAAHRRWAPGDDALASWIQTIDATFMSVFEYQKPKVDVSIPPRVRRRNRNLTH